MQQQQCVLSQKNSIIPKNITGNLAICDEQIMLITFTANHNALWESFAFLDTKPSALVFDLGRIDIIINSDY